MIRTIVDVEAPHLAYTAVTVDSVRASWDAIAQDPKFPGFSNRNYEKDFQESGLTCAAYINDSRWVANCPTEYCNGGMMALPDHLEVACFDCGMIHTVTFPDLSVRAQAEEVLLLRPVAATRNWFPDTEDVADLKAENVTRGLAFFPPAPAEEVQP